MIKQLLTAMASKRLRNSPRMSESIDEAASQYLGKAAKVELATDMVLLKDIQDIAEQERASVQHYKEKHGLAPTSQPNAKKKSGRKMQGNLILCDDFRTGNNLLSALAIIAVTLLALAFAGWMVLQNANSAEPAEVTDQWYQYDVEKWVPSDSDLGQAD